MTGDPGREPAPSRGVAFSNWLVSKATGLLERRTSRRGFLVGSAMVGSAVVATGCQFVTQPGSPYQHVTDCAGGLCTDGYTEFCCAITGGLNTCPPNTFAGGWWRADFSTFCQGTRYYIDCMQFCCGPPVGTHFCAGCVECGCAAGCDTRRIYCNYFRYGQCHTEIANTGPIACRVVTCVPPYESDPACQPLTLVDNATAQHAGNCSYPVDPNGVASLLPAVGGTVAAPAGTVHVVVRGRDGAAWWNRAVGGSWGSWQSLGGTVLSDPVLVRDPDDPSGFFVIVRAKDYSVQLRRYRLGAWGDWTALGGAAFSDTASAATTDGVYVLVRDSAVSYTRLVDGAPVGGWQSLGGSVTGSPVVAAMPSGEGLHVVVRGAGHDYLYGRIAGAAWSGWTSLGGNFTSDPAVVATSWGLAVCGRAGDERVWVQRVGPPSSGWAPLPGQVGADPTMAVDPADPRAFWVFTRGINNETWGQRGDDSGMGARGPLGGVVIADTVAVTDTSGLFLFGQAVDSTVVVNRLSGPSWSGWNPLGMPCLPIRAV